MSDFLSGLISGIMPVRGSGNMIEETRSLEDVHAVTLETSGKLAIVLGEPQQIILHAEDNILPLIETIVKDGRLKIRYKLNSSIWTRNSPEFILTVKSLDGIETTSSGNIIVPEMDVASLKLSSKGSGNIFAEKITASELNTVQSSSGDIDLEYLETANLKSELTGSGDLLVRNGHAQNLSVRMTSAGGLKAPNLLSAAEPAEQADVAIKGSGSMEIGSIHAGETSFHLTSAGDLTIGDLQTGLVAAKLSGSGDVKILSGSAASQRLDLSSAGKYLASDLTAGKTVASEATIKVTGSGSAFPGEIWADHVQMNLSSGGSLQVKKLVCAALAADVRGSGNISIHEGSAGNMNVNLISAGDFSFRQEQAAAEASDQAVIRSSGSGSARLGQVNAKTVELSIESSGDIRIENIQAEDLKSVLKGSGCVYIHGGTVRTAGVLVYSSGDFNALDLTAGTANIKTSGSGKAKLAVNDRLDALILSGGDVIYRGKPIVSYSIDGSGVIKRSKS